MKRGSQAVLRLQEKWPDLEKIVDATSNLRLEIGQCDIDKGKVKDHTRCAVAQNIARTQKCESVAVARSICYIKNGNSATRYIVPMAIQKELIAFDRGGKFMPGAYELKKPWGGNTLKAVANQKPHPTKDKGSGKKKRPFVHHTTGMRAVVER